MTDPSVGDCPLASGPLRVLVAEDNPVNQELTSRMLARLGCAVTVVANGLQAVRAVTTARYDAVVMDIQMPELNGLDAARRIRAEVSPSNQPYIIALTASASMKDRDDCLAAGMDVYLSKPIRYTELADIVGRLPGRPRSPDAR